MKLFLLFLLLSTLTLAQPLDWFSAQEVQTELNISSFIQLVPEHSSSYVEKLRVDVSFVPKPSKTLLVNDFKAFPEALATADNIRYSWENPSRIVSFGYHSIITTVPQHPLVRAKIPYPLRINEFPEYKLPTKHIDSNSPTVQLQAAKLAKGHDDLFSVVSTIGIWVKNNVDYNLTTLTADVSQSASWVLANKTGVCDELTSLFIAMLRSLGIPARFVSGLAFTDSTHFPSGWGAHGWAEVYFPGVGWVPFDPTFGEFGWVDPGHIPLKFSADPQDPATVYEWKARDTRVNVNELTLSATHISHLGKQPFPLRLSVSPLRQRVGFGSANAALLAVENLADSYQAWEFTLSRVKDMNILGPESQQLILPPYGKGQLFWPVMITQNLNNQYQYELPLVISTIRNDTAQTSFFVGQWDPVVPLTEVQNAQTRINITPNTPFDLSCALESDRINIALGKVACTLTNLKTTPISLTLCYRTCKPITLSPAEKHIAPFDILAEKPGVHEINITASSGTVSKSAILTILRLDKPLVYITNITAPARIDYATPLAVTFTVVRESFTEPLNVTILARETSIPLGTLSFDQQVTIRATSDQIIANHIPLKITYADQEGNKYISHADIPITVLNTPWYKQITDWVSELIDTYSTN